jgi:ankyrin repeat and BTB/POZ domain-containing protein 1
MYFSIRYYLSERFRLRFEDSGLEEMMDENGEISAEAAQAISNSAAAATAASNKDFAATTDEAIDVSGSGERKAEHGKSADLDPSLDPFMNGEIRTLDGDIAGDEFASDAINYQILLRKIDMLLERLKLDA